LAERGLRGCGVALATIAYPVKKERLGGHQPSEPLHDEIIFMLDLIPNGSIPIRGTKHINCGNLGRGKGCMSGEARAKLGLSEAVGVELRWICVARQTSLFQMHLSVALCGKLH
jgi:hypothetical protein